MRLSIIIAALGEAEDAVHALASLQHLRARGVECILADGGSRDLTAHLALPLCEALVHAPPGLAARFNAGADCARGDVLLFIEPPSRLPPDADLLIAGALRLTRKPWGVFAGFNEASSFRAWARQGLARLRGPAAPGQAVFVRRRAFEDANGFDETDVGGAAALSRRLRRTSRPVFIPRTGVAPAIRRLPRLIPFRA